jgi:hypothetical protein
MKANRVVLGIVVTLWALALLPMATVSAQVPTDEGRKGGRLTGSVTDTSGGALPGVAVTLTLPSGRTIEAVTDGRGEYAFESLEPGAYALRLDLAGFEPVVMTGLQISAGQPVRLDRALDLASLRETVTVVGEPPPPPPPPIVPLVVRVPKPRPVPAAHLQAVCAPRRADQAVEPLARVVGHRDVAGRRLLGQGDVLVLDGGAEAGLTVGQNLVVRRLFGTGLTESVPPSQRGTWLKTLGDRWLAQMRRIEVSGENTGGLVQVAELYESRAIAVVVHACREFEAGDFVEAFDPADTWTALPRGTPDFERPARILFGDEGRTLGAPAGHMVIDQGADDGLALGQHVTLFRRHAGDRGPVSTIGEAVVVAIEPRTATIRIEQAIDAVFVGDFAALGR